MSSLDDIKKFITENSVTISLVLLLIAVIYINIKVNNVDYKLQQTIMYSPMKQHDLSYGYSNYTNCTSRWW
jgi:hypothetical protein